MIRIYYSFCANKLELKFQAYAACVLTSLSFFVILYFTFWATYVLNIEILCGMIIMILSIIEICLSLYAAVVRFDTYAN